MSLPLFGGASPFQHKSAANAVDEAAERLRQNELKDIQIAEKLGASVVYVDGEKDTQWFPFVGGLFLKPLRFDKHSGAFSMLMRADQHAELGKHRHRGESKIYGLKGTWGYHEYDWVGKAGDHVTEVPGTVHTMYMNAGSEIMFTLVGPIDYYSQDGSLTETLDVFSFWRLFSEHLEGLGQVANLKLWG